MPTPNTPSESRKEETVKTAETVFYFIEQKDTQLWWHPIWGGERMIASYSGRPSGQTIPTIGDGWTNDPLKAEKFNSKKEAEGFIELALFEEDVFVSEHIFPLQQSSEPIKTAEEEIDCPHCGGDGYTSEHNPHSENNGDHNCDGCPIAVPCSYCYGNGRITTKLLKAHIAENKISLSKEEEDNLPF